MAERETVGSPIDDEPKLFMSIPQYAAHVSISVSLLKKRLREGIVPSLHEGRRVLIPVRAADKRYLSYLIACEKARGRAPSTAEPPAKISSPLAERAFSMGDFIVRDRADEGY